MYRSFLLFLAILLGQPAYAQLPAFYKNVSRMTWVVKDADAVVRNWTPLGLSDIKPHGETALPVEFRGKQATARVRWTSARLHDVPVEFFQPLTGTNVYSEFLAGHGDGVLSLLYQAPAREALEQETERLRALGVAVLQRGHMRMDGRDVTYLYFDTQREGKYVLGLFYDPGPAPEAPASSDRIRQYAFVVRDLSPVSAYWMKLGFPEIAVTHPRLRGLYFRGKPTQYDQDLGWHRHGAVPFEWCVPPKGAPTVYEEYLKQHGEGLQHIAFEVSDLDKALAQRAAQGFPALQGGAWGEEGKPGSGRFAYIATDSIGGLTIELLWNYR